MERRTTAILLQQRAPASSKRVLDGAPCPDAQARRVPTEGRAGCILGNGFWGTGALMAGRGAAAQSACGVVGRGELTLARRHKRSEPCGITEPRIAERMSVGWVRAA